MCDTSYFPYLQPLVPWLEGRQPSNGGVRGESELGTEDRLGTENNDIHSKWQADIRAQTGGSLTLFISPRTWIMAALRRESSNPSEVSPDIHHNITHHWRWHLCHNDHGPVQWWQWQCSTFHSDCQINITRPVHSALFVAWLDLEPGHNTSGNTETETQHLWNVSQHQAGWSPNLNRRGEGEECRMWPQLGSSLLWPGDSWHGKHQGKNCHKTQSKWVPLH